MCKLYVSQRDDLEITKGKGAAHGRTLAKRSINDGVLVLGLGAYLEPHEIKRIREKLNLSQAELAEMFGLASGNVVSNIETGFRKPSNTKILLLRLLDSLSDSEANDLVKKLIAQARLYNES